MFYFLEFVSSLIIFAGMIFLFRKKLKRSRKFITALSVVLLIVSFCSGIVLYAIPMPTETFRIEATGDKRPKSKGTTIGIKGIVVDGREYSKEAPSEGEWFYSEDDEAYLWLDESDERWTESITREITLEVPVGAGRSLVFLSGNSYGIVRISYDGISETQDLYQKKTGEISVLLPDSNGTYDNAIKLCRLAGYSLIVLVALMLAVWFVQSTDRETRTKLVYGILSLVTALTFFLDVDLTPRSGRDLFALLYDFNCSFSGNFVLGLILFPMLYKAFVYCGELYREKFCSAKNTLCIALPAGVFATFMVLGDAFINGNNTLKPIFDNELQLLKSMFAVSGYFLVFFFGITWLFNYLDRVDIYKVSTKKHRKLVQMYMNSLRSKPFITTCITLLVWYLPILMISYPGSLMGDTRTYLQQIYGKIAYSNVHPILNTHFLGLCMQIGDKLFASSNVGMFLYVLAQSIFSILVISLMVKLLVEIKISNRIIIFLIAYYLFHPRIQNYFSLVSKDIINTVFFLIFMVSLYMLLEKKRSPLIYLLLGISDMGVLLFRNDSFYVIVLSLMFIFFLVRDFRKQAAIALVYTVVFMGLWKSIMLPVLGVVPVQGNADAAGGDMLTAIRFVQIMQTARYIRDAGDEITAEEEEVISTFMKYDRIVNAYAPNDKADGVGRLVKSPLTWSDVMAYQKVWFQMFAKHPEIYIEGMLNFKYQYLYPLNCSNNYNFTWSATMMSQINNYNLEGMSSSLAFRREFSGIRSKYESLRESFFGIPIFNLFFTTGSYFWILLTWVSYLIYRKDVISISFIMPLLCLIIALILGPTNGRYFRYTYPYVFCLPFVIILGLHCIKQRELEEPPIASN